MTEPKDPLAPVEWIAFAGDWHCDLAWARGAVFRAAEDGAQVILHAGDFGYNFPDEYLDGLSQVLAQVGIPLMFVDGNHENFDRLYRDFRVQDNGLRKLTDWIWHMPRGFRWEWDDIRFLAMGGAHSVDRPNRVQGISWWPDEFISPQEMQLAMEGGEADVMISHDCPHGVDIPGLKSTEWMWNPVELGRADMHRHRLRSVVDVAKPAVVVHGHYHRYYWRPAFLNYSYGPVQIIGLDCNNNRGLRENIVVVDTHTLALYIQYCRTGAEPPQWKLL